MMTVDEALQCADTSREVDAPAGACAMKFILVYKCRRCDVVFSAGPPRRSKYYSPFNTDPLHEHICGDNQHGLADSVGFDEVPEVPEATS